jgi:hypothetical protein
MGSLSSSQQDTAAKIFDRLVTPSGARIALSLHDLVAYASLSEENVASLLEKLSQARILRQVGSSGDQGNRRYQIFHDVWAQPVRHWTTAYLRAKAVKQVLQEVRKDWQEANPDRWISEWAYKEALRRAVQRVQNMAPERILSTNPSRPEEQNEDYLNAVNQLAYEILENRFALLQIGSKHYARLEHCWLEDFKRVKAYHVWLDKGGTQEPPEANYYEGWDQSRTKLEEGTKFDVAQFSSIRRYLEERYFTNGTLDISKAETQSLIKEKACRLWTMTQESDSQKNWYIAEGYVHDLYGNLLPAISERDLTARGKVAEALQVADKRRHLINIFEMAIAVCFLPNVRVIQERREEQRPAA